MTTGPISSTDGGFPLTKKQTIAAVLGVAAVIFIAQNSHRATLEFLFFSWTAPVWIAFLVVVLLGAVIGYLGRGMRDDRKRKAAKAAEPTP